MNAKDLLQTYHHFAVLGVTPNIEKYGYKIYKRLLELGYIVYGISPKYQEVDGQKIYPDLVSIKESIDVVVFVVNPKYAKEYIDQCKALNIKHLWLQPGTYNETILDYINQLELYSYPNCILVETKEK